MTLLQAVNLILRALSEHPVASTDIRHPSVTRALDAIDIARQELLADQWWFNKYRVTLVPDANSKVPVPDSMTAFVADNGVAFVRDGFLYNPDGLTYIWTDSVQGVATFDVEFDDLPQEAQRAVTYSAALTAYSDDVGGNPPTHLTTGYGQAITQLQASHVRQHRYNARSRPAWSRYVHALRG